MVAMAYLVIPGRAKREPGIHFSGRHGFRACAYRRIPE
jgi:hypothetical protein